MAKPLTTTLHASPAAGLVAVDLEGDTAPEEGRRQLGALGGAEHDRATIDHVVDREDVGVIGDRDGQAAHLTGSQQLETGVGVELDRSTRCWLSCLHDGAPQAGADQGRKSHLDRHWVGARPVTPRRRNRQSSVNAEGRRSRQFGDQRPGQSRVRDEHGAGAVTAGRAARPARATPCSTCRCHVRVEHVGSTSSAKGATGSRSAARIVPAAVARWDLRPFRLGGQRRTVVTCRSTFDPFVPRTTRR